MIEYKIEKFGQLWPDLGEHLTQHWQEVASMPEFPLKIDIQKFSFLEKNGWLVCASARNDGKLVGYCIDIIHKHPHYMDVLCATADAYYIDPQFRAKCARGLNKFIEKHEKGLGVYIRVVRVKEVNNAGPFYKAMGYSHLEEALGKRL